MSLGFHGRADVNRNMPKLNLQNGLEISNTQDTDTKLSVSVRLPEPKKAITAIIYMLLIAAGVAGVVMLGMQYTERKVVPIVEGVEQNVSTG